MTVLSLMCVIISVSFPIVKSDKILVVVPSPSLSHQVVFRPLIEGLTNRGHEVTVITTDPVHQQGKSTRNLKEIDVHDVSYTLWQEMIKTLSRRGKHDNVFIMTVIFRELSNIFEQQLKNESVQKLIKDKTKKFDLLIVEECATIALIFSHIFKAPVIQMSSFGAIPGNMEMIGTLIHPFLFPNHYHQRIYNLTIWEKTIELYNHLALEWMLEEQEFHDNIVLQNIFGIDTPPLSQLKNNVQMLYLNVYPIWAHSPPVPCNVVYTWGIHKTPEKTLPKDLQSYLDSSTYGAIYISFGTNFKSSSIPSDKLKIFLKVFSSLPYNIIWKWDCDELPGKSENIKIYKWVPQSAVLRHPNIKLFITQGGLQSTEEAINAGVPLIGIPVIADQNYNAEKYVHFKIGIKLDLKSLTGEQFQNAIDTIFKQYDRYKNNIIQLRSQMYDQPRPPLENAIWWIEYVLRHGGAAHWRSPAANMAWTEYYELELVIVFLSVFISVMTLLLTLVLSCFNCISRNILTRNKIKV